MRLGLAIEDVHKTYGQISVLKGCSFSFERKGTYVLMGGNGSGKSTLLRICSLLEGPDRGRVIYKNTGGEVSQDISLRRRITLVLPGGVSFNASVYRNIAYGLKLRGFPAEQVRATVERMLDFVRLSHKKDQNALTLSSGESQRMSIARALAVRPEILFLDEPTASVDDANTKIIEDIIAGLRDEGITVIMTTHDPGQARKLADALLDLREGMLLAR